MDIQSLFSPLGVQYCSYFYYLSVISFSIFSITVACFVISSLQKNNKLRITDMFIISSQLLLFYFVNRLQYSMCVGSLN